MAASVAIEDGTIDSATFGGQSPSPIEQVVNGVNRVGLYALDETALRIGLDQQVGSAYDALKADPSRAVTADPIRPLLALSFKVGRLYLTPPPPAFASSECVPRPAPPSRPG